MNPAEQAHQFFEALLGGNGELLSKCHLTITSITGDALPPQTRWVKIDLGLLSSVAARADVEDVTGVYIGMGLTVARRMGPDAPGRLTVEDVTGLTCLWTDIDIAGTGHAEKPYVPNLETALAVSRCLGLVPSTVTNTGHGIQAFYRLAEPWIFGATDADDDGVPIVDPAQVAADRARAETLVWEFVTSIRIRARQLGGWYVDPVGDLARLMRVPGTHNRKVPGEALLVEIIEQNDTCFDLEQIEAVIAPRALLDPYRSTNAATTELAGVDLAGLWAEVMGSPNRVPRWLAAVLESGWDEPLCRIWSGEDDKRYNNDDSDIDMGLVATILRLDLGVEKAAQAVMARRLHINRKVEKADPAERGDYYLDRTIARVAARIRAREAIAESSQAALEAILAMADEPEPDPQPTTDVGAGEPTSNDNAVTLGVEESPTPTPTPIRAAPAPQPDPEVEHANAPRSPRLGRDPSTPSAPSEAEQKLCQKLATQLGLPPGVAVWAVGERWLDKNNEMRVWLVRTSGSVVHGGRWRINTVAGTRWHANSEWESPAKVAGLMWRDLNLVIEPVPMRAWYADGRLWLRELARPMDEGTPGEIVRQALIGMLRRAQGSALFSTAVVTRDPWIAEDARCWVALDSIRQAIGQSGFPVPMARLLMDTLDRMGCKVQSDMTVVEAHRSVTDELPWVLLADDLFSGELADHVRLRAIDRDAQDARSGIRMIGPS